MSKKFSQLEEVTSLADNDLIAVTTISDGQSKRIQKSNLGLGTGPVSLIWSWNGTDLTEFGSALQFEDSLGSAVAGSAALSLGSYRGGNTIVITGTSIQGGFMFPVIATELASLPERYRLVAHIVDIDTSGLAAAIGSFGHDDGSSEWRGIVQHRTGGGTLLQTRLTTDASGNQTLRSAGITSSEASQTTWNQTVENRGGLVITQDVWRQAGSNPNDWLIRYQAQDDANLDSGALSRQDATSFGDTSPDWDSQDLDSIGIGILRDGSALSGTLQFANLQVFTHPLDV